MEKNLSILCDVEKCKYNCEKSYCTLSGIQVTCKCSGDTCCGDFTEKE